MGAFFEIESGKETNTGKDPVIYYGNGHIWFNIHAMVSITLASTDYDLFVGFLRRAEAPTEYLECENTRVSIFFENLDEGTRNLCIADGAMSLVLNMKIGHFLALANFLERQKDEKHFRHRG